MQEQRHVQACHAGSAMAEALLHLRFFCIRAGAPTIQQRACPPALPVHPSTHLWCAQGPLQRQQLAGVVAPARGVRELLQSENREQKTGQLV